MQRTETVRLDEQLIQALKNLAPPRAPNQKDRTDRAALAALRRGLGQDPGAVPEMFQHVRELARVSLHREKDAFLVASLFGWHPHAWPLAKDDGARSRSPWTQNFGNSISHLVAELSRNQRGAPSVATSGPPAAPADSEERAASTSSQPRPQPGVERRFVALLAADRDDVDAHLRAAVGLLRQHDVPVNWLQLLRDLGAWERPDRDVQRRWARSFWGSTSPDPSATAPLSGTPGSDQATDSESD
jgi:CRISPR system Cascade subunit CasB